MKWKVPWIFIAIIYKGISLEVYHEDLGVTGKDNFCIGERVTFVCYKSSRVGTFTWSVSDLLTQEEGLIDTGLQEVRGIFTLYAYYRRRTSTSTLTFTVDETFERRNLTKIDVSCYANSYSSEVESATIFIGQLSPPKFTVNFSEDLKSFIVTLLSTTTCAYSFVIKVRDNENMEFTGQTSNLAALMKGTDLRTVIRNANWNVCKYNYTIEVSAYTMLNKFKTTSEDIDIDFNDTNILYDIRLMDGEIEWSIREGIKDCIVGYQYNFEGSHEVQYLHSSDTSLSLNLLPDNFCDKPITIAPIIVIGNTKMFLNESGMSKNICQELTTTFGIDFQRTVGYSIGFGFIGIIVSIGLMSTVCLVICKLFIGAKARNRHRPITLQHQPAAVVPTDNQREVPEPEQFGEPLNSYGSSEPPPYSQCEEYHEPPNSPAPPQYTP